MNELEGWRTSRPLQKPGFIPKSTTDASKEVGISQMKAVEQMLLPIIVVPPDHRLRKAWLCSLDFWFQRASNWTILLHVISQRASRLDLQHTWLFALCTARDVHTSGTERRRLA
jgi:hypothetical protein